MIVIPNMEKPKNCFQCSFNDGIYCALIDNDTDAFISEDPTKVSTKRLDNCPLIEIVRCGECKYYEESEYIEGDMACKYHIGHTYYTEADRFCYYGERNSKNNSNQI